jgi:hypothetical protein
MASLRVKCRIKIALSRSCLGVPVPVMQVGVVRVLVADWQVPVPMGVRFADRIGGAMGVLVVGVVDVAVLVFQRFVFMLVFVGFRQVQIHSEAH